MKQEEFAVPNFSAADQSNAAPARSLELIHLTDLPAPLELFCHPLAPFGPRANQSWSCRRTEPAGTNDTAPTTPRANQGHRQLAGKRRDDHRYPDPRRASAVALTVHCCPNKRRKDDHQHRATNHSRRRNYRRRQAHGDLLKLTLTLRALGARCFAGVSDRLCL